MKTFCRLTLVLFLPLVPARTANAQEVPRFVERSSSTLLAGRVLTPEGLPAPGAVVTTSAGGRAVTAEDGSFELAVELPLAAGSIEVTVVGDARTDPRDLAASARVVPSGMRVTRVGNLLLAPTATCHPRWLPTFGEQPGMAVRAFAVYDDGTGPALYAAGDFTFAGNTAANRIAKREGTRWVALDAGLNDSVRALAVFDDGGGPALYAAGRFTTAGGQPANRIARWDGASWTPLGSMTDTVFALAVFDDGSGPALYAAGAFAHVRRWNGANWTGLGSGMNNEVRALAVFDDGTGPELYAGGIFSTADGAPANRIARWDGATWTAVGSGIAGGIVDSLAVHDDGSGPALHAAGTFTSAGGTSASGIARWDGSAWAALGAGLVPFGSCAALATFDDGSGPALFAGASAVGSPGSGLARWDGASWSAVTGLGGTARALMAFDDGSGTKLVAGGDFRPARWNGTRWSAIETGLNGYISCLEVFDDGSGPALVAGGGVLAKWNGSSWGSLGNWTGSSVHTLAALDVGSGPALHLGAFHAIARLDGSSWTQLGGGWTDTNGSVRALAAFDDGTGRALYAGGDFTMVGGASANRIARRDGAGWAPLGAGMTGAPGASVLDLTEFDDGGGPALYAGGSFTHAGGVPASNVARWDGASWSALGSGLAGWISALEVFDDGSGPALYAGGALDAGSVATGAISRWDGASWTALGSALDGWVHALEVFDDGSGTALYASTTSGTLSDSVSRWNGSTWVPIGTWSPDGPYSVHAIYALEVFDDGNGPALFAGGTFVDSPSGDSYLAKWSCGRRTRRAGW